MMMLMSLFNQVGNGWISIVTVSDLNRRSPKRPGEARQGPSASLKPQATRFKEAPPGRSPEPRRRSLRRAPGLIQAIEPGF
ncbi:hypothetical protein GW17_00010803 [Ensete ventricosum]|nr:hypothetical protein GW17_00010803 [Ensete ventricosum]